MAGIYETAILTIAATMSKDGSGGLYAKSKHPHYMSSDGLSIREQNPPFPAAYSNLLKAWPLLQRGWVFQERYLSRRMIHFGTEEVVWECKSHREGENWWNDSTPAMADEKDLSSTWRDYVSEYTGLQFTFEKDRLVALSGVVERMAVLRQDDHYVAGLWEKTLLYDLNWTVNDVQARPSSFRGPTWSWVSTKSAVNWVGGYREPSVLKGVEVVDVTWATTYTGHVHCEEHENLGPTITIRGPLMAAKLATKALSKRVGVSMEAQRDSPCGYYYKVKLVGEHAPIFPDETAMSLRPDYLFHTPGRYYVAPDSDLFVLPFLTTNDGINYLLLVS